VNSFAEWVRQILGGDQGTFSVGLVTTSVLYCVGPMTLLGCLQDGLEGKSELLRLKATLDGISAIFFAAAFGYGVLLTAFVILVFQGALTLLARPLRPYLSDEAMIAEVSGTGGVLIMAIATGIAGIKSFPVADYLPALLLAPGCVRVFGALVKTS
jgi:uncharacterized protein